MKTAVLLLFLGITNLAFGVCSSPISRDSFSALQVLTASRLNTELNTVYGRANELPGDCITSGTITTTQISDGTILNADISASAAISRSKLAATNYVIAATTSGGFTTTSTTYVDVSGQSVTITTTGGPVEIYLIPDGNFAGSVGVSSSSASSTGSFRILRGVTDIAEFTFSITATGSTATTIDQAPGLIKFLDVVSAGTYTYKLQAKSSSGSVTTFAQTIKMVAKEL